MIVRFGVLLRSIALVLLTLPALIYTPALASPMLAYCWLCAIVGMWISALPAATSVVEGEEMSIGGGILSTHKITVPLRDIICKIESWDVAQSGVPCINPTSPEGVIAVDIRSRSGIATAKIAWESLWWNSFVVAGSPSPNRRVWCAHSEVFGIPLPQAPLEVEAWQGQDFGSREEDAGTVAVIIPFVLQLLLVAAVRIGETWLVVFSYMSFLWCLVMAVKAISSKALS